MKVKLITAVVVLVLIVGLCLFSMYVVDRDTRDIRTLAEQSLAATKNGDPSRALALISEALALLDERRPLLEVLTLHEALNKVDDQMVEAKVRLENDQKEEFSSAVALLLQALTVLYEHQKPSWSNLL